MKRFEELADRLLDETPPEEFIEFLDSQNARLTW